MNESWKEFTLSSAIEINPKTPLNKSSIYPFVEMADLDENVTQVRSSQDREYKGSGSKFRNGDTLFARITPCLENGKIARFLSDGQNELGHGSTEFIVMRGKEKITTNDYAHYLAISPDLRAYAITKMTGSSGRQRVPTVAFDGYKILIPDCAEQERITEFLESFDDKLNLLREMNATLEDIARSLFRAWFVGFKPVRAKAAGADHFRGMPQELFDALPDSFEDSEIGEIPVGWETEILIQQANWVNGAAYKNMHFSNDPDALPVIKIAELKKGVNPNTKFTNTDLGDKFRISTGELLFSWSGSPDTSIDAFIWANGDAWLNQHVFAVRPNGQKSKGYLFALLKHLMPKFIAIAKNKQTTGLGHVTRKDMERMHICSPPAPYLSWFSDFADNIYARILKNSEQIETLSRLRDTLLPKLISGEIEAPDLEVLADGG